MLPMLMLSLAGGGLAALMGTLVVLFRAVRVFTQFATAVMSAYRDFRALAQERAATLKEVSETLKNGHTHVDDPRVAQLELTIEKQNAKIDRLTVGWEEFLGKQEKLARSIRGAKGGRPPGSGGDSVEREEPDPDPRDDGPARGAQGVLPLPTGVGSVSSPFDGAAAFLPPMKIRG